MLKKFILSLVLVFSQNVFADFNENFNENMIANVELTELESTRSYIELPNTPKNPIDEIAIIIDSMIALGKKIWPIIEAGRPVITSKMSPIISILPRMPDNADNTGVLNQMANWSAPVSKSYRVSYKNYYGKEVIGFTYTIYFQYGGDFGGVGKYITSLYIEASDIYAAWGGFSFDVKSELMSISNVGSQKEPVASGIVRLICKAKGILNEDQSSKSFYIDGKGNFSPL